MKRTLPIAFAALSGVALAVSAAPASAQRFEPGAMLERADQNGDGRITRAEHTAARAQLFERFDRNGDGALSSDDAGRRLARRGGGERLERLVTAMDRDGDGRVDRNEFVNGPAPAFERGDTNRDGVLDQAEIGALRDAAARRRGS